MHLYLRPIIGTILQISHFALCTTEFLNSYFITTLIQVIQNVLNFMYLGIKVIYVYDVQTLIKDFFIPWATKISVFILTLPNSDDFIRNKIGIHANMSGLVSVQSRKLLSVIPIKPGD